MNADGVPAVVVDARLVGDKQRLTVAAQVVAVTKASNAEAEASDAEAEASGA